MKAVIGDAMSKSAPTTIISIPGPRSRALTYVIDLGRMAQYQQSNPMRERKIRAVSIKEVYDVCKVAYVNSAAIDAVGQGIDPAQVFVNADATYSSLAEDANDYHKSVQESPSGDDDDGEIAGHDYVNASVFATPQETSPTSLNAPAEEALQRTQGPTTRGRTSSMISTYSGFGGEDGDVAAHLPTQAGQGQGDGTAVTRGRANSIISTHSGFGAGFEDGFSSGEDSEGSVEI